MNNTIDPEITPKQELGMGFGKVDLMAQGMSADQAEMTVQVDYYMSIGDSYDTARGKALVWLMENNKKWGLSSPV